MCNFAASFWNAYLNYREIHWIVENWNLQFECVIFLFIYKNLNKSYLSDKFIKIFTNKFIK